MKLSEIRDLLNCSVLTGGDDLDTDVDTAVASDGMSEILAYPHPGALMITGLTNIQSVRTADVADISVILYVRGKLPGEKTIALASARRMVLLATKLGMFDTCGILRDSGLKGAM